MLILIFTLPTYAAEANIIFEKDSASNNKVKVILEVSEDQSVTKTNVVLDVKASNKANLKNAEFAFSNEVSSNSETAKWTYNNDKINLYVISKNELGNRSSNGKKIIELGTLTVNTNNNEQTSVDISTSNGGITIASVDHRTANITNDTSASTQLKLGTANSGDNEQGGNNNDNNQSGNDNAGNNQGNNQPGGSNSGNNQNNVNNGGNQSNGNNSSNSGNKRPSNSNNNNNTNSVNNDEIEDENGNNVLDNIISDTNTIKNETINNTNNTVQSSKELPETGEEEKSYIWVAIVIILILFIIAGVIATRLTKNKKHKGNYRV